MGSRRSLEAGKGGLTGDRQLRDSLFWRKSRFSEARIRCSGKHKRTQPLTLKFNHQPVFLDIHPLPSGSVAALPSPALREQNSARVLCDSSNVGHARVLNVICSGFRLVNVVIHSPPILVIGIAWDFPLSIKLHKRIPQVLVTTVDSKMEQS